MSGCWIADLAPNDDGYVAVRIDGRKVSAHRRAYELQFGPMPAGLEADHLCRVRPCLNPFHVEPVSHAENRARDAARREKVLCVGFVPLSNSPDQATPDAS